MNLKSASKFGWFLVLFCFCAFTTSTVYAANEKPTIDGLFLGQNQSALKKFKNATTQDDKEHGTISYTIKRNGDRDLIAVVDTKTNKIVQIALIQQGENNNNSPVFDYFRFNQTRNRDITKELDKPSVKAISTKYLAQIMPDIKDLNVLQYFMDNDALLTFVTKPREVPDDKQGISAVSEDGKSFVIDPSSNNRLKEDVRIDDGYLKAIVLTNSAYATTLIGRDIKENSQEAVSFVAPNTKKPQEKKPYRLTNQYKTGALYDGEKQNLSFSDANEPFRTSQTTIRDGYKAIDKPIFASEYAVIPVTFSTQSNDYYFYNLKTGKLNKFPLGADKPYLKLITRPDLSVLEARWEDDDLCKRAYYQFKDEEWRMLKTETVGYANSCETADSLLAK